MPLCGKFETRKWNIQQLKRTTCWLVFVLKRVNHAQFYGDSRDIQPLPGCLRSSPLL